ncbi:hypothetical protein [Labrenzia sp. OB1]|uniref:hypothetical protein n=1 Tax=Labrenzia sp. OB1 TaxID=1561204 RepID=UPI0007B2D7CE|nr:hypothetical protein [Labrenzia sp. OB1]KZM48997.1 hypothetical protein OA90_17585 [Labrenzia sp. OB1]
MPVNLDMSLFWVICEMDRSLYLAEADLENMSLHRIIGDIRDGQLENVQAILETNPAEGWCNDITGDVLAAAFPENGPDIDQEDEDKTSAENWSDYSSERLNGRLAGVRVRVAA